MRCEHDLDVWPGRTTAFHSNPHMEAVMPDEKIGPKRDDAPAVSRRDSVRLAAALALGAGLGVPAELLAAAPSAVRLQIKFYKAPGDGGALVGGFDLTDAVSMFVGSPAGARTQVKWYDSLSRELGTMGIPSMIQDKVRAVMSAPGD